MTRFCLYKVLTGNYESLSELEVETNLPCICLTDNPDLKSDTWEVRYVKPVLPEDPIRQARLLKILGHMYLKDFDGSLYIDNSVSLKVSPEVILSEIWDEDSSFSVPSHSFNANLSSEFLAVLGARLDDPTRVMEQINHYLRIGEVLDVVPVYWTGIMARSHTNERVIETMMYWASHVLRYSRRDQLSLPAALTMSGLTPKVLGLNNEESPYHQWPCATERDQERRVWP